MRFILTIVINSFCLIGFSQIQTDIKNNANKPFIKIDNELFDNQNNSSIYITKQIPNGYSWTIISKLGSILQVAESKYGERDKSFTILGIEITTNDIPQIWYPDSGKNIIIQITMDCLNDMNKAVYEVAHETIHCLFPAIGQKASCLEEGLAVHFATEYTQNYGHGSWFPNSPKYDNALKLIKQLFAIDADIIKKLRQRQPIISPATKELLMDINPNIPDSLAIELTKKF